MLEGWGVRGYNWEFSTGVQHEIIPRLSASVNYFRRIYGNFKVVDNEALSKSDFTEFSVVVPTDARLELSGQTIGGIYDQNRAVVNRNTVKPASDFGKQMSHWNGVDFSLPPTRFRTAFAWPVISRAFQVRSSPPTISMQSRRPLLAGPSSLASRR
jgi:hypothetical protein